MRYNLCEIKVNFVGFIYVDYGQHNGAFFLGYEMHYKYTQKYRKLCTKAEKMKWVKEVLFLHGGLYFVQFFENVI